MPFIALSPQLNIHYLEDNPSGKPAVLLLHGLGANGSSWQLQIPALSQAGFRVLAPDTPGFGQSSYVPGSTNYPKIAELLFHFLQALDVDSTDVVGISMGGTQALQLTLDFPKVIRKLVLVNTFDQLETTNRKVFFYFLLRFVLIHTVGLPTQAKSVAKRIFPHPEQEELRRLLIEQVTQADPKAYRATMRALGRFNITHRLQEINLPTLVITGEADTTVPLEMQRKLTDRIPGARQVIIPGAGHAVSVEKPAEFNRILVEFLTQ